MLVMNFMKPAFAFYGIACCVTHLYSWSVVDLLLSTVGQGPEECDATDV